jgi:hypothetical protein
MPAVQKAEKRAAAQADKAHEAAHPAGEQTKPVLRARLGVLEFLGRPDRIEATIPAK